MATFKISLEQGQQQQNYYKAQICKKTLFLHLIVLKNLVFDDYAARRPTSPRSVIYTNDQQIVFIMAVTEFKITLICILLEEISYRILAYHKRKIIVTIQLGKSIAKVFTIIRLKIFATIKVLSD